MPSSIQNRNRRPHCTTFMRAKIAPCMCICPHLNRFKHTFQLNMPRTYPNIWASSPPTTRHKTGQKHNSGNNIWRWGGNLALSTFACGSHFILVSGLKGFIAIAKNLHPLLGFCVPTHSTGTITLLKQLNSNNSVQAIGYWLWWIVLYWHWW